MADYICREAMLQNLSAELEKHSGEGDPRTDLIMRRFIKYVEDFPAADVQPVKHGYWIKQPEKFQIYEDVINSNYLYSCSCCNAADLHSERANNDGEVKFCWRCGARMKQEG